MINTYLCGLLVRTGLPLRERRGCGFLSLWRLSLRKEESATCSLNSDVFLESLERLRRLLDPCSSSQSSPLSSTQSRGRTSWRKHPKSLLLRSELEAASHWERTFEGFIAYHCRDFLSSLRLEGRCCRCQISQSCAKVRSQPRIFVGVLGMPRTNHSADHSIYSYTSFSIALPQWLGILRS